MTSEVQIVVLAGVGEAVILLLLTVLAFSVRLYRVDFNSLSEDEKPKWAVKNIDTDTLSASIASTRCCRRCWLGPV